MTGLNKIIPELAWQLSAKRFDVLFNDSSAEHIED